MKNKSDLVFSLDIGTRKVVGIIAEKTADKLKIIDVEVVEHQTRTMLDGQIHNINEVAKIVIAIKEILQKRLDVELRDVGVAVAGRALKTVKAKIDKELSLNEEITEDAVANLELEAVSSVLNNAKSDFGSVDFFCVGYSVVYYELDGVLIGDLIGHFGRNMSVEVIATFLPRVVLDSMLSVLRRAGLEIINLTLEPIAAINAIIPQDIRRLNLLLLDIGAGTSDIALTKAGSVFAYGMVPEAGDEITEFLCEKFIIDFSTAEIIKKQLIRQPKVQFNDILGREHSVESKEIIDAIRPRVNKLAESIARTVLELNQKVPHAVVLVGGGSLTPLFEKELAASFPLNEENIGIRLPEMVNEVVDKTGKLKGPDMVTPMGICIMTARCTGLKFVELYVNDKRVNVLDLQQNLDVLSALVVAGVDKMKLYGKIGYAICVQVNGRLKVIRGQMGKPAQIKLNDQKADLTTKVKAGDRIFFEDAENGHNAQGKISDVVEIKTVKVIVNSREVEVSPRIFMNGNAVDADTRIADRANIEYNEDVRVRDILAAINIDDSSLEEREIVVRINKEPRVLSQSSFLLLVNEQRATLDSIVPDGSIIEFKQDQAAFYKIKDIIDIPTAAKSIEVSLNGKKQIIPGNKGRIFMNGHQVNPDEFIIDRAEIITRPPEKVPPTVSQVLENLELNLDEQKGKCMKITVDGQSAGFTTPLSEGTDIMIKFVEREEPIA
ncbi:MAG: rod shape-determining protein [Candidatus Omnitrophica bacterium]|nr:rod shape-determining protein [Candidatus Omnitrophota bacterium]